MNKSRLLLALLPTLLTVVLLLPTQNCAAQSWEELTKRGHDALGRYDLKGAQCSFLRAAATAKKNNDTAQIAKTKFDFAELAFEKSKPAIISPRMSPTSVDLFQLFAFFLILKYCVTEEGQRQVDFICKVFSKRSLAKVSLMCSCAITIVGTLFGLTVLVTTAKEAKVIQATNLKNAEELITGSLQDWHNVKGASTSDEVLMYKRYASFYEKLNRPVNAATNFQRAVIIAKRSSKEIQ